MAQLMRRRRSGWNARRPFWPNRASKRPRLGRRPGPPRRLPGGAGCGRRDEPEGVPYGTDATHLEGIATVVFGPGDIAQAHTADEWVDLAQVEAGAEISYRLMRSFTAGEW